LKVASQIQVDKIFAVPRPRIAGVIGTVDNDIMPALNAALSVMLGVFD